MLEGAELVEMVNPTGNPPEDELVESGHGGLLIVTRFEFRCRNGR